MAIRRQHAVLEELFDGWETALGQHAVPYRNHAYRVFNLAAQISHAEGDDLERLAVAAAFHDVGIWLDETFDYLGPSAYRADVYLRSIGHAAWIADVRAMIEQHHKVFPWLGRSELFVDAFRRADWLDVTFFVLPSSLPRRYFKALLEAFPRAGFHGRIAKIAASWIRHNPTRPLPMFKL